LKIVPLMNTQIEAAYIFEKRLTLIDKIS
jgi:hypothetical protein